MKPSISTWIGCRTGRAGWNSRHAIFAMAAFWAAGFSAQSLAQQPNNLNISPKRVVFAGANAATAVYIFNRGDEPVTYRIELVDRVMLPSGEIRAIRELASDPASKQLANGFKSAADMVQFSPRRITLAPGQSQAIRLRLLRPATLQDGEYRTTLTVSALPPEDAGLTAEQLAGPESGKLGLKAVALFGVSIPVIVRQGQLVSHVHFEQVRASGTEVHLNVVREGQGSVYGDLEVHEKTAKGPLVGLVRGVGVYEEVGSRTVNIPLTRPVKRGEPLALVYRDDSDADDAMLVSEPTIGQ